jgi:hypothetical protein
MRVPLTDDEMDLLRRVADAQEADLVGFCIELDQVPGESFSIDDFVAPVFEGLVAMARSEGLPLTKYDADDLSRFDERQLAAFANALGVRANPGDGKASIIGSLVSKMRKVGRKLPSKSQIPIFLTYFLPALVRHFSGT